MGLLLLVGRDKTGDRLVSQLEPAARVAVYRDASTDVRRVARLICRGRLGFWLCARMAVAEFWRRSYRVASFPAIRNNAELLAAIRRDGPAVVCLFRAGLIIGPKTLQSGAQVVNVHCARLPEFGGLGAVARALRCAAYEQEATLHRVVEAIDEGEVLATEPYRLDPAATYAANEDIAYDAGIRLVKRWLRQWNDGASQNTSVAAA